MGEIIRMVAVRGRVQGVGYRAWVEYEAIGRGLRGFVRNRRDGSVEALFAGPEEVVNEMILRCSRGPSAARVENVADQPAQADALNLRYAGEDFSVLPTL